MLSRYLLPHRGLVGSLTFLLLSSNGLQLVTPKILGTFVDTARSDSALDEVMHVGLLFLAVAVVHQVLAIGARYVSEKLAWTSTNQLREDLAMHCLRLDMSFHNKRTPGEMIERVDGDVGHLANLFSHFTIRIVGSLVLLIGVLAVLYFKDWRIGAAMMVYAIVTILGLAMLCSVAVPAWKEAREASAGLFGFLEEHLSGTEDIRANGGQANSMNLLFHHAGNRLRTERSASLKNVRLWGSTTGFHMIGHLIALGAGYTLFPDKMTAGGVLELIWYTEILFRSLERLTREMEDFQRAGVSIGRIDELRRWSTTITARPPTTGERTTLDVTGPLRVTFDDVTFGYDPEEPVLHDINLEIAPGRVFGLLGRTGSGKTTISRLLFRLYDVQRGEILIDGADIRTLEPEALRHRLGIVTQSVQLFRGTVRDNLTFFDRSIPDSHIDDVVDPWASPNGSRPCPKASTRSCKAATVVCRPGKRSCWCSPACSSRIPVS
ncbi:MAG: ABC transporter ATP-binding protein [Candidatus Latescibacterota bacterium]